MVTDWGAVGDRVKGLKAGLDLEMPASGGQNDALIVQAVKNSELDEKLLDRTMERLLKVLFSYVDHRAENTRFDYEKDHEKAVEYPWAENAAAILELYLGGEGVSEACDRLLWAFGHGLSYTTYAYSNLKTSSNRMDDDSTLTVSVDVTNMGTVAGKEVVQLYVSDQNGTACRLTKELKGFSKVEFRPGESKTVTMKLTARDLSY